MGPFQGHHHHHHKHSHAKYQRPTVFSQSLGLYALKKLDAMNPRLFSVYEQRLLNPVAPGVITYLAYAGIIASMVGYSLYIWRGAGLKAFVGKSVLPVIGMGVAFKGITYGMNMVREQLYSP